MKNIGNSLKMPYRSSSSYESLVMA